MDLPVSQLQTYPGGSGVLIRIVPNKKVKFGNAAGSGPDLVYADNEMLWNATRLREVHENWQALFPSEFLSLLDSKLRNFSLLPHNQMPGIS
jgi:hypothetical protein